MSRLLFLCCFALLPLAAAAAEPSLTIYHQNFAVVRGAVALDLHPGVNEVHFADLTAQVEPSSVVLRDPAGEHDFQVLEQGYRGEPVSQSFLLAQCEGQTIDFLVQQPQKPDEIVPGRIVRSGYQTNGEPIIEVNGTLRFALPGKPLFPKLAGDNILKPELIWKIASAAPAKFEAEIDYITGGMTWSADYNITIPESGDELQLTGWVTIDNQSGKRFENARTKLISGDVNKVEPTPAPRPAADTAERVVVTGSYIPVPEKAFDEFHLYTLPRPVTLRDRESKQIEFTRAAGIHSNRLYVFDATGYERAVGIPEGPLLDASWGIDGQKRVGVLREFKNSEENHLGLALPAGRWRFLRRDRDGQLEFTGEHDEEHAANAETLRIFTGTAFDLATERRQTDFAIDPAKKTMDEAFEIKLRNHKTEPVEIRVVEHLNRWRSWEIAEHSQDFTKRDAHTIEFVVRLKPDEEKSVSYRARYTQLPTK